MVSVDLTTDWLVSDKLNEYHHSYMLTHFYCHKWPEKWTPCVKWYLQECWQCSDGSPRSQVEIRSEMTGKADSCIHSWITLNLSLKIIVSDKTGKRGFDKSSFVMKPLVFSCTICSHCNCTVTMFCSLPSVQCCFCLLPLKFSSVVQSSRLPKELPPKTIHFVAFSASSSLSEG